MSTDHDIEDVAGYLHRSHLDREALGMEHFRQVASRIRDEHPGDFAFTLRRAHQTPEEITAEIRAMREAADR